MSKQQMSKNEPVDKTVDLKLGKWREKSIAMEEERKKEEEERRQQGKFKCFMQDFTGWVHKEPKTAAGAAIGVLVLVILLVSLICAVASKVELFRILHRSGRICRSRVQRGYGKALPQACRKDKRCR